MDSPDILFKKLFLPEPPAAALLDTLRSKPVNSLVSVGASLLADLQLFIDLQLLTLLLRCLFSLKDSACAREGRVDDERDLEDAVFAREG
jgi:hypothetical protein